MDKGGVKTLIYLYDFGDCWEHAIKVEKLLEPEAGALYSRLIDASGRCPPEDVGGPIGYADYLEAIRDPDHEQHEEMVEWGGLDFDPDVVDVGEIRDALAGMARKWSRRKSRARP